MIKQGDIVDYLFAGKWERGTVKGPSQWPNVWIVDGPYGPVAVNPEKVRKVE